MPGRQKVVGCTGLNALSAAEDSVVTVPEKLQIQSLIKSASCSGSIPGGGGRACLGTDPWGSCCTPWSCRAVCLKLHSTLESADISQCPGHTQINYIRIRENGTQDSGFLKLPSYTHWEAKIENPWSRGHSSLGHRAGGESACFLRAALTSWSVGGPSLDTPPDMGLQHLEGWPSLWHHSRPCLHPPLPSPQLLESDLPKDQC